MNTITKQFNIDLLKSKLKTHQESLKWYNPRQEAYGLISDRIRKYEKELKLLIGA